MRPDPKKRVDTSAPQNPLGGMDAAFSGLALPSDLPAAPPELPAAGAAKPAWKLGRVVLRRERAQRGGKTVVVIDNFATHLPLAVIEDTAKTVRAACGCGGTVKGRTVEVQGDQPAKVRAVLEAAGFQVAGVK